MNPEQVRFFHNQIPFRLRDLLSSMDPEDGFDACARLAAWAIKVRRGDPPGAHDGLLQPAFRLSTAARLLAMRLSATDPHFFHLAKRMAAQALLRRAEHEEYFRQIFAVLLVASPPRSTKPTLARDLALIAAVRIGEDCGWHALETQAQVQVDNRSACGRLARRLEYYGAATTYSAIEKAWKGRSNRLKENGFSTEQASDFLGKFLQRVVV